MATLASKLANWTAGQSFEKLGPQTVHEAKRRMIDSIGCALGAYHKPPGKIARAKAMEGTGHLGGMVAQHERDALFLRYRLARNPTV